jgi:hypothetical protein
LWSFCSALLKGTDFTVPVPYLPERYQTGRGTPEYTGRVTEYNEIIQKAKRDASDEASFGPKLNETLLLISVEKQEPM